MSNDSVHIKNAKALHEGLTREITKREELQGRVDQLERQLSMFKTLLQDIDQQLKVLRATRTSTGPTQR